MEREDWNEIAFDKKYVKGIISKKGDKLVINGEIKNNQNNDIFISYWASDPADKLQSYAGTYLPFVSKDMAYSKRINVGRANIKDNKFQFEIKMPNSFYKSLGTNYIPPIVNIRLCQSVGDINDYDSIQVSNGYPYKYLNHPANICTASDIKKQYQPSGPLFYTNRVFPLRSQEQIFRESAMPKYNKMPPNFWGSKPSV